MSFLLPAQDDATRKRRAKWIAGAIGLAVVAWLAWSPARASWKYAHARKLIAEAEAYAAQNRGELALARATEALQKGGQNTRTLRLLLTLQGKEGDTRAFSTWAMLARDPDASFDDRRELLRWAVAWGQIEAADQQWLELQKEKPMPPETVRAGAAYFEARGDPERAVVCAQETVALDPEDIETRILLGRVLARNGSPVDRALGRRLLLEQSERLDSLGLQALRLLAATAELPPYEAQQCFERLVRHPLHSQTDELAAGDLRMQVTPYKRASILTETALRFASSKGELLAAGKWLLNHGAFEQVLEMLPLERAREQTALGLLYLDALAGLNRWSEVERTLTQNPGLAGSFESSLYRARAAGALDQTRLADLHWKQALENADKDSIRLLTLATYAKAEGAWSIAEQALRALAGQKMFERRAFEELVQLERNRGRVGNPRAVLAEMRSRFPEDPAIENDLAYLNLLEGKEIPSATGVAEKLAAAHPNYLSYRVTLALGRLRQGRPEEARSLLDGEEVNWSETAPAHRAVYAAILDRTGEASRARLLAEELAREALRTQERELVAHLLPE